MLLPWRSGYVPSSEVFVGVDRERYSYAKNKVSDTEFQRRHKLVRDFMRCRGLDCLLVAGGSTIWNRGYNNTRWIAGHVGCQFSHYDYVVFPLDGEPTILTIPMYTSDPGRRARPIVEDVRGDWGNLAVLAVQRIKELGHQKGTIGFVTIDNKSSVPLDHWRVYQEELPDAKFEFVGWDWWKELRRVRSKEEIRFLEYSARIGDKMHEAIRDQARPGMTESELFAVMFEAMLKHEGEIPTMVLAGSFNMREHGDFLHETPHNRTLRAGDIILTEIAPRYPDGSECQTGRSFCLGEPPEEYRKMFDLMWQTYHAVVDAWRPGSTDMDIQKAAEPLLMAGYRNATPLCHGAEGGGGGPHVFIRDWAERGMPRDNFEVVPGMVFTPEIYLTRPDFSKAVYVLDSWVTTEDDPRCLHRFPQEVVIIE